MKGCYAMALITGSQICSHCGKTFEWEFLMRSHYANEIFDVSTIKESIVHPNVLNSEKSAVYELGAYCPFCGEFITFSYNRRNVEE